MGKRYKDPTLNYFEYLKQRLHELSQLADKTTEGALAQARKVHTWLREKSVHVGEHWGKASQLSGHEPLLFPEKRDLMSTFRGGQTQHAHPSPHQVRERLGHYLRYSHCHEE